MDPNAIDDSQPYIVEIPGVLTAEECAVWIGRIQEAGPELATVNTRRGGMIDTDVRNNRRVIFDRGDWAQDLFERVKEKVPQEVFGMKLAGVNERLRCYEYKAGQRFKPHKDGAFYRNSREKSFYTYMVYLNEEFEGGETTFLVEPEVRIKPKTGHGLIFQHKIIHEGSEVFSGVKYVVRTDLMYRA